MTTDSDQSTKTPIKVNKIFVFGNPDLPMDSFPLRILPELRATFLETGIEFVVVDPNEEWEVPEEFVVLDTVVGLKDVVVFEDLERFIQAPNISMHDFDALANLRFLKKLGKIKRVQVIGVPPLENSFCGVPNLVSVSSDSSAPSESSVIAPFGLREREVITKIFECIDSLRF